MMQLSAAICIRVVEVRIVLVKPGVTDFKTTCQLSKAPAGARAFPVLALLLSWLHIDDVSDVHSEIVHLRESREVDRVCANRQRSDHSVDAAAHELDRPSLNTEDVPFRQ